MTTKLWGIGPVLLGVSAPALAVQAVGTPLGNTLGGALGSVLGIQLPVALGNALPVGIGGVAAVAAVGLIVGVQLVKRKKG